MQHNPAYDWIEERPIKYFNRKLFSSQFIWMIGKLRVGEHLIEYHFILLYKTSKL
jgi:hypothetical protein